MIQPGTILGNRYEILKRIGSGGMADVYQAKCHKLNRYVAIKVLRQEYNEDEEFLQRFIAEAQATAGLLHPNIVTIYDAGEDQGCHYIVMELCEGTTLKQYIRRYGRLSVKETVDITRQIASGLLAAHNMGIVHRDIKPQNILISESGQIKIADFGIARAAATNTNTPNLMGSVHYLSPEQAKGRFADRRSDIYSLGITMFEMATGKVPFDGDNSVSVALMHLQEEITPPRCYFPDIPASLERIILKCTMKRTLERYQNAQELLDDLEKVYTHPDGEYIFLKPEEDKNPTIFRGKEELEMIKEQQKNPTIPAEDEDPSEDVSEEFPLEEMDEDEESMQPQMRKMIYAITAAGVLMLVLILGYLVVSSLGIWRFSNKKQEVPSTTEASTEAAATTMPEMTTMPNVLNYQRVSAEKKLQDNDLKAKFIYDTSVEDESDDELIVIEQQYPMGEKLEKGTTVNLILGPDPASKRVEVPLLINETEEQARETLKEAGLEAKVIYANSDEIKDGYVLRQNPPAGTEVDRGFTITITVSKGLQQVKVPSITGTTPEEAKKELNDIGLELGRVTSDYSGSVGIGEIFRQSIESGIYVDKGTAIDVVVSIGEHTSYHYEGEVIFTENPFEDGETGDVELVLKQGNSRATIYSEEGASSASFPLHSTFSGEEEGSAVVILYIDDVEYERKTVEIHAVED